MPIVSQTSRQQSAGMKILAVVVVFKQRPLDTSTVRTLLEAAQQVTSSELRLSILIVDNTPGGQEPGELPPGTIYWARPHNPGLSGPYNEALALAEQNGDSWLLTLDQDTQLPGNFLRKMREHALRFEGVKAVAAISPRILDHGRLISPFRFVGGSLPRVLPQGADGISKRFTSALNSASLLRVSAVRRVGGYDVHFPLHNSDTSLFHRLDQGGFRIAVASDVQVVHELAILERSSRMTLERYRRNLVDECFFWDLHMGFLARAERLLRLVGRVSKGYLRREDPAFLLVELAEIRRRVRTSRAERIRLMDLGTG